MAPPVAPTTTRGTRHDNPWAGIEPRRDDDNANNHDGNRNRSNNQTTRGRVVLHEGFWLQMLDIVIQMFLCLDACAGMFWVIFGTILHYKHDDSGVAVACMVGLGSLYLVRTALVTAGLWVSTESVFSCERGGLVVAGYLSATLAVILGAGTCGGLICAKQVQAYMKTHSLDLKDSQIQWLLAHYAWVLIILAIGAAVEGAKWSMYGIYHRSLLLWEEEQERLENQNLIRREAATGRPWWWSSNSSRHRTGNAQLTQALLADDVEHHHDGNGSTTHQHGRPRQRRGLFSFMFRRRRGGDSADDARDDGSVDFASVQEEWASRAEEDPVWWSRDNDDGDDNMNNISRVTTDVDTSWAHDVSQV